MSAELGGFMVFGVFYPAREVVLLSEYCVAPKFFSDLEGGWPILIW